MASKKYYWLKLKDDFFRDKRIKKLRRIAGGDTYTIIYLKMQLLSLKDEGVLYYEGVEDQFYEEIALEIDEEVENVKVTMMFLVSNGMLEEVEKDKYLLPETVKSIGSESSSAARVRKHRETQKALQCNTEVTQCNVIETNSNTEIEIEKEIELDIDKETDKDKQQVVSQLVNQSFAKLVDFVNNNIQAVTPFISELLGQILDEYKDVDLILAALQGAITNTKTKNKIKYAEGTLRNWKKELITTYEQLKAKEERDKNKPQLKNGRTEVIPEWFNKRNQQPVEPSKTTIDFEAERKKILAKLEGG